MSNSWKVLDKQKIGRAWVILWRYAGDRSMPSFQVEVEWTERRPGETFSERDFAGEKAARRAYAETERELAVKLAEEALDD